MFDKQKQKVVARKVADHLWDNKVAYRAGSAGFGLGVMMTLAFKKNTKIDVTFVVTNN